MCPQDHFNLIIESSLVAALVSGIITLCSIILEKRLDRRNEKNKFILEIYRDLKKALQDMNRISEAQRIPENLTDEEKRDHVIITVYNNHRQLLNEYKFVWNNIDFLIPDKPREEVAKALSSADKLIHELHTIPSDDLTGQGMIMARFMKQVDFAENQMRSVLQAQLKKFFNG